MDTSGVPKLGAGNLDEAIVAERANDFAKAPGRVAIVVTTYNHAHYLADALRSIAAQTRAADEVIVVDDGSHDNPAAVVALFSGVRLIRQENQGLAAARNTGLYAATADWIAFLDADDVYMPEAIAANLAALARVTGAALAYGAHLRVDNSLAALSGPHFIPVPSDGYREFLRQNPINMHACALIDRAKLIACGAFDPEVRRCEDYDCYLRLTREHPVACHPQVLARYRQHGGQMSDDPFEMLRWALSILDRYRPAPADRELSRAWREGRRLWTLLFLRSAWRGFPAQSLSQRWRNRARTLAVSPLWGTLAGTWHITDSILPDRLRHRVRLAVGRAAPSSAAPDVPDAAPPKETSADASR